MILQSTLKRKSGSLEAKYKLRKLKCCFMLLHSIVIPDKDLRKIILLPVLPSGFLIANYRHGPTHTSNSMLGMVVSSEHYNTGPCMVTLT